MAGYTKLFASILDSSVWDASTHVRIVWVTMLAMADQDGIVEASVPGLAKRANVDRTQCEQALAMFMAPDPDSRTVDHEGRRIEPVDGGWRLLNHGKYADKLSAADKAEKNAIRQRRFRERKAKRNAGVTGSNVTVTPGNACNGSNDTHTQTISDADDTQTRPDALGFGPTVPPTDPALGAVLTGFRTGWQARYSDAWMGPGKHRSLADDVARSIDAGSLTPERLVLSLAGYFASMDPFVCKSRHRFVTWASDVGRWVADAPRAVVPDEDHVAKRRAEAAERTAKIYGGAK